MMNGMSATANPLQPPSGADSMSSMDPTKMDLQSAQQTFLTKANEMKANDGYWGPGGRGGIEGQSSIEGERRTYTTERVADPYGLVSDDERFFSVNSSEKHFRDGTGNTLMSSATVAGRKLAGGASCGRGLEKNEIGKLEEEYNENDAYRKYVFASDKVRGGYLESERKLAFGVRRRELAIEKEARELDEMMMGEELEFSFPADYDGAETAPVKRKNKFKGLRREEQGEREGRVAREIDEMEGMMGESLAPEAGYQITAAHHTSTVSPDVPQQINNAPPLLNSDNDDDDDERVTVVVPDASNPGKTRLVQDKLSRYKRREERKRKSGNRVHKIMEMDPNYMKELREDIRQKREETKNKRIQQQGKSA